MPEDIEESIKSILSHPNVQGLQIFYDQKNYYFRVLIVCVKGRTVTVNGKTLISILMQAFDYVTEKDKTFQH